MSGEEEENAAELKIGEEFLKAKCLMNCEVARILDHKYDQLQQMSADPTNQISQLCVLGNLCPDTVEEAIAIVPSIKSKGRKLEDDAIEKMLHDLSLIKKFE